MAAIKLLPRTWLDDRHVGELVLNERPPEIQTYETTLNWIYLKLKESTMRRMTMSLLVLFGFLFCFNASSFAAAPTATFSGTDTTTQGNWMGTYGSVGYYIPNGPSQTPSDGSTFNQGAANPYTWGMNVPGTSALKTSGGDIASSWYNNLGTSSPSVTFDIIIPSGKSQTVALYLLDYDKGGRSESVTVTDANNDSPPLSGPIAVSGTTFAGGEYLVWTITGEVHINITLVTGANAVASGLFFGENSTMPPPVTPDLAGLAARVAKLEGQIVMSDLVGTYQVAGIQNELGAPNPPSHPGYVGAYVYSGTLTLNADGTGSSTAGQFGKYLFFGQSTLGSANQGPATTTFNWAYSNGLVTFTNSTQSSQNGQSLSVTVGGRVMTFASANPADNTDVLLILTRLQ
jgi:hypothetical protein